MDERLQFDARRLSGAPVAELGKTPFRSLPTRESLLTSLRI
jgi:hypothetical protein